MPPSLRVWFAFSIRPAISLNRVKENFTDMNRDLVVRIALLLLAQAYCLSQQLNQRAQVLRGQYARNSVQLGALSRQAQQQEQVHLEQRVQHLANNVDARALDQEQAKRMLAEIEDVLDKLTNKPSHAHGAQQHHHPHPPAPSASRPHTPAHAHHPAASPSHARSQHRSVPASPAHRQQQLHVGIKDHEVLVKRPRVVHSPPAKRAPAPPPPAQSSPPNSARQPPAARSRPATAAQKRANEEKRLRGELTRNLSQANVLMQDFMQQMQKAKR